MTTKYDKILVVDDNPSNIEFLEEILEGYNFHAATSGEEALQVASKLKPAVVFLDIMMPGLNGYQVCQMMRKSPTLSHTKIIMVSAKATIAERLEGYDAGADDYIVKPFNAHELLAKLRVYLRLRYVEEMDMLKNDLLDMLCLETNNPLNTILSPLHKLIDSRNLDIQDQSKTLNTIVEGIISFKNLIEKTLVLCELKTGKSDFNFEPTDLSMMIKDAVMKVQPKAHDRNVVIDLAVPNDAIADLDKSQMDHVLTTLLNDTILSATPKQRISVKATNNGGYFNLIVNTQVNLIDSQSETGIYDACTNTDYAQCYRELHQLNVAVAQYITMKHNGKLDIDPVQNSAALFSLRLPVEQVAKA